MEEEKNEEFTGRVDLDSIHVYDRILSAKKIQFLYDLQLESTNVDDLK